MSDTGETKFYYYESSVAIVIITPIDKKTLFDIKSPTVEIQPIPGLTGFLTVKRNDSQLKDANLRITLTPSNQITPTNLSFIVSASIFLSFTGVKEEYQPLPTCETTFKILFESRFGNNNKQEVEAVLAGHSGKISCEVKLTVRSPEPLSSNFDISKLLKDIASPDLADFIIHLGNAEFKSHKLVLSARSPVLRAMLANKDCKESMDSEMTIVDTTEEAMEMFLKFMYTAELPDLELMLYVEVLKLSEKYQVKDLKILCERKIAFKMSMFDPLHEIYQLSFAYNCSELFKLLSFEAFQAKFKRDNNKMLPQRLMNKPKDVLKLVNMMQEFDDALEELSIDDALEELSIDDALDELSSDEKSSST